MSDRGRLQTITDGIVQLGLLVLVVASPLMFGSVYPWAYSIVEWVIAVIAGAWLLKVFFIEEGSLRRAATARLFLPAFLFILLLFLQLLPLPPTLLRAVSPRTAEIYSLCLSDIRARDNPGPTEPSGTPGSLDQGERAPSPTDGSLSLYRFRTRTEILKWLSYLVLLSLIMNYRPEGSTTAFVRRIVIAVCASGALVALIGLGQKVLGARAIYGFWKPLSKSDTSFMGPFVNANHFAGYIELTLPTILAVYTGWLGVRLGRRHTSAVVRGLLGKLQDPLYNKAALALVGLLLVTASLFLSFSRAGVVSFLVSSAVTTAVWAAMERRLGSERWARIRPAFLMGAALVFLLFAGAALFVVLAKTGEVTAGGRLSRLPLWFDTLRMYRDFPLFGVGLGTFSYVYPLYKTHGGSLAFTHAENDYLQLLVETGAVGFVLVVWFFAGLGREILTSFRARLRLYRQAQAGSDPAPKATRRLVRYRSSADRAQDASTLRPYPLPRVNYFLLLGCLWSLTAIALHSLADFNMHIPANALTVFVLLGLACRLPRLNKPLFSFSKRDVLFQ